MIMQQVKGSYPPPHARYLVKRGFYLFVATPCYGMHNPWWVPSSPKGETEPIPIEETDKWTPIEKEE